MDTTSATTTTTTVVRDLPGSHALAALVGTLWDEGGTVPYAIASAIVVEACKVLASREAPTYVTLERITLDATGSVALSAAETSAVCEPMVDLGIVGWELFVGRRFSLSDVLPGGDVPSLVDTCSRDHRSIGSLERRVLAAVDPVVARATSLDPNLRYPSFDTFALAMDAAVRGSSSLRIAAWLASVTRAPGRAPFVTPSPPAVRISSASRTRTRRADGFDAVAMLADLAPLMPPAGAKKTA